MQGRINGEGGIFVKNNKRAGPNKTVQRGFFFSKLINVHARLFGTLDYIKVSDNATSKRIRLL